MAEAGKVTVIARCQAKAGAEEQVKQALLGLVVPSRLEAGCIDYDLHQANDDLALFVFYENWVSIAALEEHGQMSHSKALGAQIEGLLAEPFTVTLCHKIGAQE